MFRKSRWKIVLSILSPLILLLFGTLSVIYIISYADLTNDNQILLEQYVKEYSLSEDWNERRTEPMGAPFQQPRLELSTFYSVAISKNGQVLKTDTADVASIDEDVLIELAEEIIESGKSRGVRHSLIYQVADKGGYTLVAFLDNTLMAENVGTLFFYTLIFGSVSVVVLFFLSIFLSHRIVAPLEESYKRQKQFISDAGHELKTPVAVVNTNLELLIREIGENPWVSNIQYENERMSELITQLLELARTENVAPPMSIVDLSCLVYGEILPFESVAYESGVRLETDIAGHIQVQGNDVQLKQLVSILIDNAVRHSPDGREVSVQLRKSRHHVYLSVINEGNEIPPEQRKYLFERFYRGDAARTGEENHYGLGLAIAKAIVDTHKGTIQVQCGDGKVKFVVTLSAVKQKNDFQSNFNLPSI